METHGIHTEAARKEITCADCGHVYLIAREQRSGVCSQCGNVAMVGAGLGALSEEIVAKRVLPRLKGPVDPLEIFRATPDGAAVEKLRIQFQVEWQLWAELVKYFGDPVYHMAYLATAIARNEIEQATARYRDHRAVMALLADSRWQSEVADLMLSRLEAIQVARLPAYSPDRTFDFPQFLKALPYDSRVMKVAWIAIGMCAVAKIAHL